ncbi:MAG: hypothetical protein V4506_11170 [Bacteroidota bacterium]
MKVALAILVLFFSEILCSQNSLFPEHLQKTQIAGLQNKDSLVYYQCHVDEATQELTTSSGQKITSKKRKVTITEKFIIVRKDSVYICKYYTSPVTNYPNKKFPYLTLKEVDNWNFEYKSSKQLSLQEMQLVSALEAKTHAIVHYELNINKSCSNEIIIFSKRDKEQFIVEGDYLLSKILNCN